MTKIILALVIGLFPFLSLAADKPSDAFSYSVVARVCEANKCQSFDSSSTVRVTLTEDPNKPGNFAGEINSKYSLKGINFESKIQISQFAFGQNYQTNLYLVTSEVGSSVDHGSTEIIVGSLKELNSIAQYSTPFVVGDSKVDITLVVGSTPEAVSAKVKLLTK